MRSTYLFKLYRYDKKLFYPVAIFGALTLLCNLSGKETTPFFVWGMYSENIRPQPGYDILRITVNDSVPVDTYARYSDNTRTFLNSPLAYYRKIKECGFDPAIPFLKDKLKSKWAWVSPYEKRLFNVYDPPQFMNWYQRYLEKASGLSIHAISIDVLKTRFDQAQQVVEDSSYLFETWRQP